jgi:hypothetical protein
VASDAALMVAVYVAVQWKISAETQKERELVHALE